MAIKISRATGNFLTAGTWGTVDATSYSNSESATTALTTSFVESSTFTPGAITVDGLAIKLSVRTGTTGTMSVHLAIAGVEVTGTLVAINTADLPVATTADLNGGWIFFKFTAPVLLLGATLYSVGCKTSSSSQVSLFSTATTNWSRAISTTTTGAPAAGDDFIVCGEYTGAGTSNAFVVTMNETATTDYGAASTSLVTPSCAVCSKGTFKYGNTGAVNYYLRQSGNVIVYSGGEFDMGVSGAEIPRDGSAFLNFDSASNVDFGLTIRNLGTWKTAGLSRTIAKLIDRCFLNTDEAIASTSLGVDTDTGWLDNDFIAVASTTRTASQSEAGQMNGNAAASTLTVDGFGGAGGGLAFAHSGTAPIAAEVILLTRNVQIFGASTSLQGYVDMKSTATVSCSWTEFKWMGSNTANKRGLDVATTTGSSSFTNCSAHDFVVANSMGFNVSSASGNNITISSNVTWNIANNHFMNTTTTGVYTVDSNIWMLNVDNINLTALGDLGITYTNNTHISGKLRGFNTTEAEGATIGTVSNITAHSNTTDGVNIANPIVGTITTITTWRNTGTGMTMPPLDMTIASLTAFGNTTDNLLMTNKNGRTVLNTPILNGDTTFATTNNIRPYGEVIINLGDLSSVSGIKTAATNDLNFNQVNPTWAQVTMNTTKLGAATEVASQTNLANGAFVRGEKNDATAGLNKMWKKYGTMALDTGTVHTGSQSMSLTPNNASNTLESSSFYAAVANGATVTSTVFINKSAAYNGNQPRLIAKRNDAIGITVDTVLATYSAGTGSWNSISGTTIAVTDDGVVELVVDCSGTAGIVYVDTWSVS